MNRILMVAMLLIIGMLAIPNAAAISNPDDGMGLLGAGQRTTHDIYFKLDQILPADGKIKIGFNPGFNITQFTNDTLVSGVDGSYTWTKDLTTNEIIITRSGSGTPGSASDEIAFTLGNITNPSTTGSKSISIRTMTSSDIQIEFGTTTVTIEAGPVTQLTLGTINNQVAGMPFTVTVTAKDQFGNIDTTFFNYSAVLSSTIGAIEPPTMDDGDWINGVWTGSEVITKTGTGTITATSGSVTGTSNTFTITPDALGSFVIATIPAQFDELAFTVTAQAKDTQGNNKTDYNAVNNLTLTQGLPGTVTLVSPSPATVQFVNGVYSGQVTLNVTPNPTPATLQTGVKLTITNVTLDISKISNGFSISLPVDLKNSTVVANPAIVIEDGSSISTITVTVKNGINQGVIPSATVVLTSDRSWIDSIVPASNITDSNGQATFSIKSSYPGKANLTATVWGTELEKKAVVTFGFDNMLHLSKDWNLISVPRQLDNSALSALSTTKVDRIYTYDADKKNWKYALYNRTSGTWNGTLTTIDDGKGYWMFASAVTDVPVVLKSIDPLQLPPTYPLKAGWNMIGYTSMQLKLNTDVWDYFYPDLFYQSDSSIWVSAYDWTGSGFDQASPYGDSFSIVRTKGYWIYLKDDATLVP